jgi:diphthamide biosynthesis protein 7
MIQTDSLKAVILDLPPSCIEFWPVDPQYAVVGTYNLEKTAAELEAAQAEEAGPKRNQQRNGSLILIQVQGDDV